MCFCFFLFRFLVVVYMFGLFVRIWLFGFCWVFGLGLCVFCVRGGGVCLGL